MDEWWSYRPSDFLMFSPRTYWRLFELYNEKVWPSQLATVAVGVAVAVALRRRRDATAIAFAAFALLWGWVAFGFVSRQLADVHTAAGWVTAAFALQAVLLLVAEAALAARAAPPAASSSSRTSLAGVGLIGFAVVVHPLLAPISGRPWQQAEVFGIAPDPTVIATLGLLAAAAAALPRWLALALWAVPLAWCVVGATTLATMGEPQSVLMPAAAAIAIVAARNGGGRRPAAAR